MRFPHKKIWSVISRPFEWVWRRTFWRRTAVTFLVAVVFFSGAFWGAYGERRANNLDLTQFWRVYSLIKSDSIHPLEAAKAVDGATKGLVESLGDPYSSFLTSREHQSLEEELSGQFEGIGAELVEKDQMVTVVAPLSDTPAEKAGLKAGDIIVKIDDKTTEGLSLEESVGLIRGPKGSAVKLTVARQGAEKPIEITITRDQITVKSVRWRMMGNVGYIEIRQFGSGTDALMSQAVNELSANKPTSYLLDLRNNPGGYLDAVPPIAGLFIPPSIITIEKYRDGKMDEIRSSELPVVPTTPLYVLVNGGSASAAEILAGALQDYKRATLLGEKTFGKGSVQDVISLKSGALRLTIAEWLTPNKRAINKVGIEPDVKLTGEKKGDSDPMLEQGLEYIRKR